MFILSKDVIMKYMARYFQWMILLLSCCVVNAWAVPPAFKKSPSYLFVLSAQQGVIAEVRQRYVLTLKKVDSHVLWFADRPIRKAGFVSIGDFIASWSEGFRGDPPNAALVHVDMLFDKNGHQQPVAVEISHPSYNGRVVTFQLKVLHGDASKLTQQILNLPKLFIDPPAARITDFHQCPMTTPVDPINVPHVSYESINVGMPGPEQGSIILGLPHPGSVSVLGG